MHKPSEVFACCGIDVSAAQLVVALESIGGGWRPCPGSDPPPASAAACSRPATASPHAPGSHPSRRTLTSRHRSCASTRPLPAPRLRLSARFQLFPRPDHLRLCVPAPRHTSSAFRRPKSYSASFGKRGSGQVAQDKDHYPVTLASQGAIIYPLRTAIYRLSSAISLLSLLA